VTKIHTASGLFMGQINLVFDCYIMLLFGVLFLFIWESKDCALTVCRTIVAQTHTIRFLHCSFPLQKDRMYSTEIDLSWADRWLVRSRSANLRFISHLRIVSLGSDDVSHLWWLSVDQTWRWSAETTSSWWWSCRVAAVIWHFVRTATTALENILGAAGVRFNYSLDSLPDACVLSFYLFRCCMYFHTV